MNAMAERSGQGPAVFVTGWVPQISLSDGMARTEEWLRAEGYLTRSK